MNLLRAFLAHINHYFAQLPYNLNWGVPASSVRSLFARSPLVVFDVGARGGSIQELDAWAPFIDYYAFEADAEECARLAANPPRAYHSFRIFPYFLGSGSHSVEFNVYDNPVFSSVFRLDPVFNHAFLAPPVRLERTISLSSTRLDEAIAREALPPPDVLKIDTQGGELDVLRGAGDALANTLLVEVEVEFLPIYQNQPLFADVDQCLRLAGLELLYLNRCFLQRKGEYRGLARGQIVFGDALYGKSSTSIAALSAERIAKYIAVLCHYGHLDLARHIYQEHLPKASASPELRRLFSSAPSPIRRGLVSQLDKFICLLLHLRKTNHLHGDSDRSWPIR